MSSIKNLILLFCGSLITTEVICAPDYYWRDFYGTVPDDALLAVFNGADRTYVGNVQIFKGGLFIGQLKNGSSNITISANVVFDNIGVRNVNKNIKILCTQHPENFEWMPADYTTLPYLPEHLVVGGWERDFYGINYIGRAIYQNELLVGKIVGFEDGDGLFLYIPVNGQEQEFSRYEVLIYKEHSQDN